MDDMTVEMLRTVDTGESVIVGFGLDDKGNVVKFAGDRRAMQALDPGDHASVPSWAVLSRAPAFEVIDEKG